MNARSELPIPVALDPREWLISQQTNDVQDDSYEESTFISVGEEAIQTSNGNVREALSKYPDLRAEIAVVFLMQSLVHVHGAQSKITESIASMEGYLF